MATRLIDQVEKIEAQEKKEVISKPDKKSSPVARITENDFTKDKQISAKVNARTYKDFSDINKMQGISNNSALNMLISQYVRENRSIINEE